MIKNLIFSSVLLTLFPLAVFAAGPQQTRGATPARAAVPRPVAAQPAPRAVAGTSTAPVQRSSAGSSKTMGFGFATYGTDNIGMGGATTPALSLWLDISDKSSVQALFGIASTSPFAFGVGGVYRQVLMGDSHGGLHGGLGLNLGTMATGATTSFFLNVFPVVGFHFGLGGLASNVRLSFDGGPFVRITPAFQFGIQPVSAFGGAAIHYFF